MLSTDSFGVAAVTMHRRAPCNPLKQEVVSEDSVCCMVPLLSGRKYVRVGSGPMTTAFHTSNHTDFNDQIMHPAIKKMKIVQRMKGCAPCATFGTTKVSFMQSKRAEVILTVFSACSC